MAQMIIWSPMIMTAKAHEIKFNEFNKLYICSCGLEFQDENAAAKHADDENFELHEQQKEKEKMEVSKPTNPQREESVSKPAEKTNLAVAKTNGAEKGEKQVDFGSLPPFHQAQLMVQKYAKQLLGDERASAFALNLAAMARHEPKISKCTPESIIIAMKACIDADLMPNTFEQHAIVVPYWNSKRNTYELQFQIMFKGLAKLARNTGEIKTLNAELIYEGDFFEVELGTERRLIHKPSYEVDRTDGSKVTHAYMTAVLTNGEKVFEVVTKSELDKIKKKAIEGKKGSPWDEWEPEMQKKTAVKRGAKLLPSSPQMQAAIQHDSLSEAGKLAITASGELIEKDTDRLTPDIEAQIYKATTNEELEGILQSLTPKQKIKAVELIEERFQEIHN